MLITDWPSGASGKHAWNWFYDRIIFLRSCWCQRRITIKLHLTGKARSIFKFKFIFSNFYIKCHDWRLDENTPFAFISQTAKDAQRQFYLSLLDSVLVGLTDRSELNETAIHFRKIKSFILVRGISPDYISKHYVDDLIVYRNRRLRKQWFFDFVSHSIVNRTWECTKYALSSLWTVETAHKYHSDYH